MNARAPEASARVFSAGATVLVLASLSLLTGCQGVSSGPSAQVPNGNLTLGTQTLDFGSVTAGNRKTLTVSVTNSGGASASVNAVSVSGTYYSVTAPTLPVSIQAGQSVAFSIEFAPNASGSFSATVSFTTSEANSPLTLGLTGTGTATTGAQLTVAPATIAVGDVVDGTSGTASGTLTAQGGNVTVTAASTNSSSFAISGLSLPVTITAGQSLSFTVIFSPLSTGAATATLTLTSNAQPSQTTATLTGTGTAASTHTVSLSWKASSSPNIVGYNLYRAPYSSSCGSYSKINSTLNTGTLYTDSAVVDGKSYCYAATAVNSSNEESAYSNIVSNVQIPAN